MPPATSGPPTTCSGRSRTGWPGIPRAAARRDGDQAARRGGAKLVPLLQGGASALAEARQEARDLGLVIDEETIKARATTSGQLHQAPGVGRSL